MLKMMSTKSKRVAGLLFFAAWPFLTLELNRLQSFPKYLDAVNPASERKIGCQCAPVSFSYDNIFDAPNATLKINKFLRGQKFLTGYPYNIGGTTGVPYSHYHPHSAEKWQEWLEGNLNFPRPARRIAKAVSMTKNDWPLIRTWTYYHGKMFGFENLYILDSSSDERCRRFLLYARDTLGANIIFTAPDFDEILSNINFIMRSVSSSSDLVMKVDPDEFVVHFNNRTECLSTTNDFSLSLAHRLDCSLDPFGVFEYLQKESIHDGKVKRFSRLAQSIPDKKICASNKTRDLIYLYPFMTPHPLTMKKFYESRTFDWVDLGHHNGASFPPFNDDSSETELGLVHLHSRCIDLEVRSSRDAVLAHQYINESDSDAEALKKLEAMDVIYRSPCNKSEDSLPHCPHLSCHKVIQYAAFLSCPNESTESYYRGAESLIRDSVLYPLFAKFIIEACAAYIAGDYRL